MENETENKTDVKKISDEVTMNVLKTIFITIPSIIVIGAGHALSSVLDLITFLLVCTTICTLYHSHPELSGLFHLMWLGFAASIVSIFQRVYCTYRQDMDRRVEDEDI